MSKVISLGEFAKILDEYKSIYEKYLGYVKYKPDDKEFLSSIGHENSEKAIAAYEEMIDALSEVQAMIFDKMIKYLDESGIKPVITPIKNIIN